MKGTALAFRPWYWDCSTTASSGEVELEVTIPYFMKVKGRIYLGRVFMNEELKIHIHLHSTWKLYDIRIPWILTCHLKPLCPQLLGQKFSFFPTQRHFKLYLMPIYTKPWQNIPISLYSCPLRPQELRTWYWMNIIIPHNAFH